MNEYILIGLLFLIVITIHELGHVIATYLYFKKFPKIRITKFLSIFVISGEHETIRQASIIALAGIYVGAIPLIFIGNYFLFSIYLIMCIFDLSIIGSYLIVPKHYRDKEVFFATKEELKDG